MLNGGYINFSLVIWSIADWYDIFTLYLLITLKPLDYQSSTGGTTHNLWVGYCIFGP